MKAKYHGIPCPQCGSEKIKVIDTRAHHGASHTDGQVEGPFIRRRRACLQCSARFTTYETIYKEKPSAVEEFLSKVVHYHEAFGVQSEPGHSVYEAMAATA